MTLTLELLSMSAQRHVILRLKHLDCAKLTAKQRDDLSQSYAGDIGASLGHAASLASLSGAASEVTLTPAGAGLGI